MSSTKLIRPSQARRQALSDADNQQDLIPLVSNFFPIERYYDASDKVLDTFLQAFNKRELDDAYVYGKRYCTFCLEALPKHDYYKSPKYAHLLKKNHRTIQDVVDKLEQVALWMDAEEEKRQKEEAERRRRYELEKARIAHEREQRRFQELQQRIQQQKRKSSSSLDDASTQASALQKLELLNQPAKSNKLWSDEDIKGIVEQESQNYNLAVSLPEEPLPPPMLPPPPPPQSASTPRQDPPPSYSQAVDPPSASDELPEAPPRYDQLQLSRNKHFFGEQYAVNGSSSSAPFSLSIPGSADVAPVKQPLQQKKKRPKRIPFRQLREQAYQDYQRALNQGRIKISPIPTYQGRNSSSTNGCTVISALVVSRHLKTSRLEISNDDVVRVIDSECGPFLRQIRNKLQLPQDSLIVPSDVHDHLVDANMLKQDWFLGATGGNILDPDHIGELIRLLEDKDASAPRKTGATLFFREHVISIVQRPNSSGGRYYDLVDSMPTFSANGQSTASRTRCTDVGALETLLLWYACRKFSDSNCSYLDRNEWNEMMADLDPRVFQGFVWAC